MARSEWTQEDIDQLCIIDPATGFIEGSIFDEDGLLIVYHVFTNGWDERPSGRDEADAIYERMLAQEGCARLYVERFASELDYRNDKLTSEDCLRSDGDYPL